VTRQPHDNEDDGNTAVMYNAIYFTAVVTVMGTNVTVIPW